MFCLVKRLTILLTLDEMLWYIIILIKTNDPPPKFGTVDSMISVCSAKIFFYMPFNSLIIERIKHSFQCFNVCQACV